MTEEPLPPAPPSAPEHEPFWSYIDLAVFAGAALPCLLLGLGLVKLVVWAAGVKSPRPALVQLPAQAIGYLLLFGVLALMFKLYDRPFWRSLGWVRAPLAPGWAVSAGASTAIAVATLGSAIGMPNRENDITRLLKDPLSIGLVAGFAVLLAPVCEELAFRGFLQPLLARSFGPVVGVLGAAVPFGLLHFSEYGNSWRHALLIAGAGAAFGWMRQATGSTRASALMHAAYNGLFFAAFLAARQLGRG
ncbi:MAG: CPBP family intramembrane metalloprotease [Acidobacteriota bacterium]|nr:CPBP family intramembrane metalloprotease [Acidobacteriota bacterium]